MPLGQIGSRVSLESLIKIGVSQKLMSSSCCHSVCCCPPNLSRTLGMLGGYTWRVDVDESAQKISVIVYLFMSCTRTIDLPNGKATISMQSGMPWKGETVWEMEAPEGWTWEVTVPAPRYAANVQVSNISFLDRPTNGDLSCCVSWLQVTPRAQTAADGFVKFTSESCSRATSTMDLPVRLLSSHPSTGQDTLTVTRGPIVYVAEDTDNDHIEATYPHFENLAITENATLETRGLDIRGHQLVGVTVTSGLHVLGEESNDLWRAVGDGTTARGWKPIDGKLEYVPWFARANRGGRGHVRVSLQRA